MRTAVMISLSLLTGGAAMLFTNWEDVAPTAVIGEVAAIHAPAPVFVPAPPPPPASAPPSLTTRPAPVIAAAPDPTPVADTILAQMLQASLVFTLPESAQYGDDLDAELVMSLMLSELELAAQNPNATLSAGILVSRIVEARLSAPDFEIVSSSGTRQALSDTDDTVWRWQLRPKSAGLHRIRLTVVAAVDVGGERTERLVQTFDKTVVVKITHAQVAWSWLAEYWQWLISTLLIPLGVWVWNRTRGKGA